MELRKLPLNHYDVIYIDGSHENPHVLEDAIISWRLLKRRGILIFDDYARRQPDYSVPRGGINTFMRYFGEHFERLHNDHQLIMKKR